MFPDVERNIERIKRMKEARKLEKWLRETARDSDVKELLERMSSSPEQKI